VPVLVDTQEGVLANVHRTRVAAFESLYDEITKQIEKYRDDGKNGLSDNEREWLTTLIIGFRERFKNWIPEETTYLRTIYERKRSDTFVLAAHAYLHIAYDLPLVIAGTLGPRTGSITPPLNEHRARQLFLSLRETFERAFRSSWSKPTLVKLLQAIDQGQGRPVFTSWVIQLRNGAWHSACDLAYARVDQPALKLHQQVQSNLERALARFWLWDKIFAFQAPDPIASSIAGVITLLTFAGAVEWHSLDLAITTIVFLPVLQHVLKRFFTRAC
jgi:hypothetical protein